MLYPTLVVTDCPVPGTWLVREPGPIPLGQTEASASTAVHHYPRGEFGGWWSCEDCGSSRGTTRTDCQHVRAVRILLDAAKSFEIE